MKLTESFRGTKVYLLQRMALIVLIFCAQARTKDYRYIMCCGQKWLEEYFQLSYASFFLRYCVTFVYTFLRVYTSDNIQGYRKTVLHIISITNNYSFNFKNYITYRS